MQKTATENRLKQEQSAGVTAVIWNEKAHNKKFKADKNFVTKVALRGFTPPQLLRQFCRWQNRFCGLTHCYADTHTGVLGEKNEKVSDISPYTIFTFAIYLCK